MSMLVSLGVALAGALLSTTAPLDGPEKKDPASAAKGKVYEWKSANGIPYEYFVPKSYDPKAGANLVLILHGNGMSLRWGFANLVIGEFRPDDVLVSPEGPSYLEATKAWEFLEGRDASVKVHELIDELKKTFKVKQTFLYGHSQGSFFVFQHVGEFPNDVDGVVGQSGALWMSSKLGKSGHGKAIAFLHGSDDANVPWLQSAYGRKAYRDADYPLVHLRTLWGHPHAPVAAQTENQLAWCEGMTSPDPARVAAALETLSRKNVPYGVDFAALFAVASRLEGMAGATPAQKAAATKAKTAVDKVAKAIAGEIDRQLGQTGKSKLSKVDGKPWLGLATAFLEDFDGVAACAAWAKIRAGELAAIEKAAGESGREFGQQAQKDPGKALSAGADLLEKGWRSFDAESVAQRMEAMLKDPKAAALPKKEAARVREVLDAWSKGRKEGFESYAKFARDLDL